MQLTDFMTIVDLLISYMVLTFQLLDEAIIIDDPVISLFDMMIGFVVLELILVFINSFRGRGYTPADADTGVDNYRYPSRRMGPSYKQVANRSSGPSRLEQTFGKRRRY